MGMSAQGEWVRWSGRGRSMSSLDGGVKGATGAKGIIAGGIIAGCMTQSMSVV